MKHIRRAIIAMAPVLFLSVPPSAPPVEASERLRVAPAVWTGPAGSGGLAIQQVDGRGRHGGFQLRGGHGGHHFRRDGGHARRHHFGSDGRHRHFAPQHRFDGRHFGGHRSRDFFHSRPHTSLKFFLGLPLVAPAPVIVAPPVVIQRPPQYWYYCRELGAYYPYVTHCPGEWVPVVPH